MSITLAFPFRMEANLKCTVTIAGTLLRVHSQLLSFTVLAMFDFYNVSLPVKIYGFRGDNLRNIFFALLYWPQGYFLIWLFVCCLQVALWTT